MTELFLQKHSEKTNDEHFLEQHFAEHEDESEYYDLQNEEDLIAYQVDRQRAERVKELN
jgi:hypothetical protein